HPGDARLAAGGRQLEPVQRDRRRVPRAVRQPEPVGPGAGVADAAAGTGRVALVRAAAGGIRPARSAPVHDQVALAERPRWACGHRVLRYRLATWGIPSLPMISSG